MRKMYFACITILTSILPVSANAQAPGLDQTAKSFIDAWGDKPPKLPLKTWSALVSYRPPIEIQRQVIARGAEWAVHRIDQGAVGPLNLDYYSIRVKKLPNFPGTNNQMQPKDLLLQMRRLLDARESAADGHEIRRLAVSFEPFDQKLDKPRWTNPTKGAVLRLHFFVPGQLIDWKKNDLCSKLEFIKLDSVCKRIQDQFGHSVAGDEGCIVLSEVNPSNFRVSTIRAGAGRTAGISWTNAGAHPVSGNREFGFSKRQNGSGYTYYVIGADRLTGVLKYDGDVPLYRKFGFAVAEVHWRLLIDDLQKFVIANKGELDGGAIMDRGVVDWEEIVKQGIWSATGQPGWEGIPKQ